MGNSAIFKMIKVPTLHSSKHCWKHFFFFFLVQMDTAGATTFFPLDHEEVLGAIFLCAIGHGVRSPLFYKLHNSKARRVPHCSKTVE